MKTAAAPLVTFFNTARQALQFDLWTFTLASGTVVQWTDADVDIAAPSNLFLNTEIAGSEYLNASPVLVPNAFGTSNGVRIYRNDASGDAPHRTDTLASTPAGASCAFSFVVDLSTITGTNSVFFQSLGFDVDGVQFQQALFDGVTKVVSWGSASGSNCVRGNISAVNLYGSVWRLSHSCTYLKSCTSIPAYFGPGNTLQYATFGMFQCNTGPIALPYTPTTTTPIPARTFTRGPIFQRDRIKWVRGIEVDTCNVDLSGPTVTVDGQLLPVFAAAGGMDGADVTLERVYMNDAGVVQGSLMWFSGIVADVFPSRMGCKLTLKSPLAQLAQQLPRNLYQSTCLNDLFDSNCNASRAANTVTGTVTAVGTGYNPTVTCTMASSLAAKFAELGNFKFTSGANAGLSRTVQGQPGAGTSVVFQFARPMPFTIAVGNTISVTAGCDKVFATCGSKFSNTLRFRGQPWIPVPETVT